MSSRINVKAVMINCKHNWAWTKSQRIAMSLHYQVQSIQITANPALYCTASCPWNHPHCSYVMNHRSWT